MRILHATAAAVLAIAGMAVAAPGPCAAAPRAADRSADRAALHLRVVPGASSASARVAFFGLSSKTAIFPAITGTVAMDRARPDTIAIDVALDVTRLTAGDALTEQRLKGPAFFDAAHTPVVRFAGGRFHRTDPTHATIEGTLAARGVMRPVTLDVTFSRPIDRIDGSGPLQIRGEAEIDRRDFGMKSYPLIVGRKVTIAMDINLEADTGARN